MYFRNSWKNLRVIPKLPSPMALLSGFKRKHIFSSQYPILHHPHPPTKTLGHAKNLFGSTVLNWVLSPTCKTEYLMIIMVTIPLMLIRVFWGPGDPNHLNTINLWPIHQNHLSPFPLPPQAPDLGNQDFSKSSATKAQGSVVPSNFSKNTLQVERSTILVGWITPTT